MNARTLTGKSIFFLAICMMVGAYTMVFGQDNSLVGVFVVIIALVMLGSDLSLRPVFNLAVLLAFTLAMGLGAFIALIDPFLGLAVNFSFVFVTSFVMIHDLKSPVYFPFLLGYAFMLCMPVTPDDLPVRIFAIIVGSVLTVGLNVLLNRNRMDRACHKAIMSMCDAIGAECEKVISGLETTTDDLDAACSKINSIIYDRLKDGFLIYPKDRPLIGLVTSLQSLGRAVCLREHDPATVSGIASLMGDLRSYEDGSTDLDRFRSNAGDFLRQNPDADIAISASIKGIVSGLVALAASGSASADDPKTEVPRVFRFRTVLKENLRTDSVRFTFAIRMAVLFSAWAFVWQYWELQNAKWLLFTTVAVVQPYVEGSWAKSSMRIIGTLAGACAFIILSSLFGGMAGSLTVIALVVGYIYTVTGPKRYDLDMTFVTLMALLAASMADPSEPVVLERVLYTFAGVALATAANHALLPYHIRDENLRLSARYLEVSSRQLSNLAEAARGGTDRTEEWFLTIVTNNISAKIRMNLGRDPDAKIGAFLAAQDALMAECTILSDSLADAGPECRARFAETVSKQGADDGIVTDGMNRHERDILMMARDVVRAYGANRAMYDDAVIRA